jgi:hypothetical protein
VGSRRGVASIIGTMIFVLVFVIAFGLQAYMASVQAHTGEVSQQVQQLANQHGKESLAFQQAGYSLSVVNNGVASVKLVALLLKFANGTVYNLPRSQSIQSSGAAPVQSLVPSGTCGSSSCLQKFNLLLATQAPGNAIGLVTSLGNTFWFAAANSGLSLPPSTCPTTMSPLTVLVSPPGAGTSAPSGTQLLCTGQQAQILAQASFGYAFQGWTGTGTGSYSGVSNPATLSMGGGITETANFVAAVLITTINQGADGFAQGTGIQRTAIVTVSGAPQIVSLSASAPSGVAVSFNPASLTDSPAGATTSMTVSYAGAVSSGNLTVVVTATGANGQSSSAPFTLSLSYSNGKYSATSNPENQVTPTPRMHSIVEYANSYLSFTRSATSPPSVLSYQYAYYSGAAWASSQTNNLVSASSNCANLNVDVSRRGNYIFLLGNSFTYNFGILGAANGVTVSSGGTLVQWFYPLSAGCSMNSGALSVPSLYGPTTYYSVYMDPSYKVWVADAEVSGSSYFIHVLRADFAAFLRSGPSPSPPTAIPFTTVLVTQPLASQPVPQIMVLPNGYVVLVYTVTSSACYGDYILYSTNDGTSWNGPIGPEGTTSASYPLCFASSSGTSIGDTVYFAGKNSAGNLAYWSFNFDTKTAFTPPSALASGVDSGMPTNANGFLAVAYTKFVSGSGEQLYWTWTYNAGASWMSSPGLSFSNDAVSTPAWVDSFQLGVLERTSSSDFIQTDVYTI